MIKQRTRYYVPRAWNGPEFVEMGIDTDHMLDWRRL